MHHPEPHLTPADDPPASELHLAARDIEPGDHLPPQRALHGTPYQHDGFTVGSNGRDVLTGLAVLSERMLLFGPGGTMDSLAPNTSVIVRRRSRPSDPTRANEQDSRRA